MGQGRRWRERAPGLTKRWLSTMYVAAAVERERGGSSRRKKRNREREVI